MVEGSIPYGVVDYCCGIDLTCNRNEYQEYLLGGKGGQCVGLLTLAPSCAECLEIWAPRTPGALRACIRIAIPFPASHIHQSSRQCFIYLPLHQSPIVMSWLHQRSFFVLSSVRCSHSRSIIMPVSHIDTSSFQRRAIIQNHNLELIGTSPLTLHSVKFWRKCKLLLAVTVTAYHWNRDWCVHVPVQYRVLYGLWILSEDWIPGGTAVIKWLVRLLGVGCRLYRNRGTQVCRSRN